MKRSLLAFAILGVIFSNCVVMAEEFDSLQNLTSVQKQKLSQLQFSYKTQIDALETRIMAYQDKLAKAKSDTTKTKEQIALLTGAYERNISTLETQKKQLEEAMKKSYQSVMTPQQYQQYSTQQIKVQDAFSEFVRTAK
ncbi:MAG: hypothetical protein IJY61_08850 [Candidatus Gastranaerophilales bacterium]|nr:hypothetical protein [Candidatus Gastranaerophilales bacterium]